MQRPPQVGSVPDPLADGTIRRPAGIPEPLCSDPNPGGLRALLHAAYDLLWLVVILLASPWWVWRSLKAKSFRTMVAHRLTLGLKVSPLAAGQRRVLIHGVSVGEVKAAQSLVEAFGRERPDLRIVISTTTETGVQMARSIYPQLDVVRFPVDLSMAVARFLRLLDPACVVLIELEIWPNFLRQANRQGVPVAVVNGRITENSFGNYRLFRDSLPQFNRLTLFCAQDQRYAERFAELGHCGERVVVTGNLKVDGLKIGRRAPNAALQALAAVRPGQLVVVAGSTHEPEEQTVVAACQQGVPAARLILVPRHPNRSRDIQRSLAQQGTHVQLLTELRAGRGQADPDRPLLVDTIGELEQVYALADLVFVGGSLIPHGGQNVLEPAAQGRPVLHGPHMSNFKQEALLLQEAGAARVVADGAELAGALAELGADSDARALMAAAGIAAVESQRGAAQVTIRSLVERCLSV